MLSDIQNAKGAIYPGEAESVVEACSQLIIRQGLLCSQ